MADPVFEISDLRGGINNSDSPTMLRDNEVVDARNIDFRDGACGAKRRGTQTISMSASSIGTTVIALIRHTPTNLVADEELWAIDENGGIDRRVAGVWQGGVTKVNSVLSINSGNYDAKGVSLHGKLFIAAKNAHDRSLVWDGTVLRWVGFWQSPDPGVANSAPAGAYTGTRYFRVRYTQQVAGVTTRRAEPSNAISLVPSGVKSGAVITKLAGTEAAGSLYSEAQTHWEVEASTDNVLFYRIATVAIGTATYTDTTAYATGYSAFPLSEDIGEYVPPGAARHVAVDEDRMIFAGSHTFPALDSTVWWTPVGADDGVGSDERIPTATNQKIAFDGLDGGAITCVVTGAGSAIYVFKKLRIYKMGRTGVLAAAYDSIIVSSTRGALPGCAVAGTDHNGVPCVYFLDANAGLCRGGARGIEDKLATGLRTTWRTRNVNATIQARLVFHQELEQVLYSVALVANTYPSLMFGYEAKYGSNLLHTGVPAVAKALALFPDASSKVLKPIFGTASVGGTYVHQGDTGVDDSGTSYQAYIITKPYLLGGLWQKFRMMGAVLLARAATGTTFAITLIRNFGLETRAISSSLTPVSTEERVIRPLDNATFSELNALQIQFGDSAASTQVWSLDQISSRIAREEASA